MEAHIGEAALKRIVMANAERTIALVDSSKLGVTATHRISPLNAVHTLITDDQAPASLLAEMRRQGIAVLVAGNSQNKSA
jgi:DeoR/GlpR family transcriptional regulator of sugar metabolism